MLSGAWRTSASGDSSEIKHIKDLAAGAVLITSIVSLVVGLLIFGPIIMRGRSAYKNGIFSPYLVEDETTLSQSLRGVPMGLEKSE
ncbi:MAG: diacylglycerol kinase [Saprospiraceae bacterium]|nr:diacylglycerol kinase [Candidatus Opimibacter iunctus]